MLGLSLHFEIKHKSNYSAEKLLSPTKYSLKVSQPLALLRQDIQRARIQKGGDGASVSASAQRSD